MERVIFLNRDLGVEKEFLLLARELKTCFSTEQIQEWAKETHFMKRKAKLKPEYFLLLCSLLGEQNEKESLMHPLFTKKYFHKYLRNEYTTNGMKKRRHLFSLFLEVAN